MPLILMTCSTGILACVLMCLFFTTKPQSTQRKESKRSEPQRHKEHKERIIEILTHSYPLAAQAHESRVKLDEAIQRHLFAKDISGLG